MEWGLTSDIISLRLWTMKQHCLQSGLESPHPASQAFADAVKQKFGQHLINIRTAARVRSHSGRFNKGGVALARLNGVTTAGLIWFFFYEQSMGTVVCFCPWERIDCAAADDAFWRFVVHDDGTHFIDLSDLIVSVVYRRVGNSAWVYIPPHMRM